MSVEVKTPTKTQFEHTEFQCGDKKRGHSVSSVTDGGGAAAVARPIFNRQTSENLGVRNTRKRRYSERAGGDGSRERYLGAPGPKRRFSRGGRGPYEKIVLPTKFLLGGNINDPLNLNSLSDEAVNRALNENTPKSSPLAVPYHRQHVHVIIPTNIEDPLGLMNSSEDPALLSPRSLGKKKKRNKHKKKNQGDKTDPTDLSGITNASSLSESKDFTTPVHIEIFSDSELPSSTAPITPGDTSTPLPPAALKLDLSGGSGGAASYPPPEKVVDHIVSPVIPQITSPKSRRRKRTSSEGKSDGPVPTRLSLWGEDGDKGPKSDKTSPHRTKFKRQHSHSSNQSQPNTPTVRPKPRHQGGKRHKDRLFIYGNYSQYYGYRNPGGSQGDDRLKNFQREWFNGKDILDIGCNAGHVTLEIAKNFNPRKITGIDIDSCLIGAAKKNIRHYLTSRVTRREKYPSSLVASFGPIAAPPVKTSEENTEFPNNVSFMTANYVLESDELVDMAREEYDMILALSVTKWMHLNWGDVGLKRTFRRMFKQLRPGGKLILEPQLWPSYKKRKKLTPTHLENFSQIKLRPEQFREYLLREVGFSKSETLEVPYNKAKGFQRPLLVFTKSSTTQPCSRVTTPGRSDTSRGATPRFLVGWSGTTTPNTCDSYDSSVTYTLSPSTPFKDTPKGDPAPMDTIPEVGPPEKTLVTKPVKLASRPFADLRTRSAPAILERKEGSELTVASSIATSPETSMFKLTEKQTVLDAAKTGATKHSSSAANKPEGAQDSGEGGSGRVKVSDSQQGDRDTREVKEITKPAVTEACDKLDTISHKQTEEDTRDKTGKKEEEEEAPEVQLGVATDSTEIKLDDEDDAQGKAHSSTHSTDSSTPKDEG